MRNNLITKLSTCMLLAAVGLTGCEGPSQEQITGEQLDALLEKMDQLDYAAAPVPGNALIYTVGTSVNGVDLPGSNAFDAAYIDQALVLLPDAKAIASNGNAAQKQAANTIIASILADEGSYLTNQAESAFQSAAGQVSFLRNRTDMVKAIIAYNNALAGDRAAVIDTMQTGNLGNGDSVDGIDQITERVAAATAAAAETRAKIAEAKSAIAQLRDETLEYEALDLTLTNESDAAQGAARYAKLEKATVAMKEAQLAEAKADALEVEVKVLEGQAALAESRKAQGEQVINELAEKIAKIKAERQTVADKLAQLEQDRVAALAVLTKSYNDLDALIQAGGFDRMAQAASKFNEANDAYTSANLGSRVDLRRMGLYTLHARSLQQQRLAAQTYAAMLGTLSAAGPGVLGAQLHQTIEQRIAQMTALEASVKQAAADLDQNASGILSSVSSQVSEDTDEGKTAGDLVELYQSLITTARG